jgi:uncharacterized protein (DUF952 family)
MTLIWHIIPRSLWLQAQETGQYRPPSLDAEGFIHCSTPAQVSWVANTFYQGQADLVLLGIDPERLQAELKYDLIETGDRFPHLYGPLNLEAVVQVLEFAPNDQGEFTFPLPNASKAVP